MKTMIFLIMNKQNFRSFFSYPTVPIKAYQIFERLSLQESKEIESGTGSGYGKAIRIWIWIKQRGSE
jgi:hypothetical protein